MSLKLFSVKLHRSLFSGLPRSLATYLDSVDRKAAVAILRQFRESPKENLVEPGFSDDPLFEVGGGGVNSVHYLHKYDDRLLVLIGRECPVLCRFCTRKRLTFSPGEHESFDLEQVFSYLSCNPMIDQVIFSGGEPFNLYPGELEDAIERVAGLPGIKKVRIHSRSVVLFPVHVKDLFFQRIKEIRNIYRGLELSLVIHVNRREEISEESIALIQRFQRAGFHVKSQSVLLKKVNDSVGVLGDLFSFLGELGVQPYYIHQLDKVAGAGHFEVEIERGKSIIRELFRILPAKLVPSYMLDGKLGKRKIL